MTSASPLSTTSRTVPYLTLLRIGLKDKSFHFYGRLSRRDFWLFYGSTLLFAAVSVLFLWVPVVGSLIMALLLIYLVWCQSSAMVRRLHDRNYSGKWVLLPFVLLVLYFVVRMPLYALHPEQAAWALPAIALLSAGSYLVLLVLCALAGQVGSNRFGTDPLDSAIPAQDFINPEHLEMPVYLGDPWRKFKDKQARAQARAQAQATAQHAAQRQNPSLAPAAPSASRIEAQPATVVADAAADAAANAAANATAATTASDDASLKKEQQPPRP